MHTKTSFTPALRALITCTLPALLAACTVPLPSSGPDPSASAVLGRAQIARIVASPARSEADRTTDQRRKPDQMLDFIGIRPGMIALDVSAGGGYTTELLARAIGPTGAVYGQSRPVDPGRPAPAPAAPEGATHPGTAPSPAAPSPVAPATVAPSASAAPVRRPSALALAERDALMRAAGVAAAPIQAVVQPFENPAPASVANGGLDLVTLIFNYHDLGFLGIDRARMNRAIFRALKPGGMFVIADHAGRPGTGISESGTLHRIEEAFLRREVEEAGFRLVAEGRFLRNPNDPRDRNTPMPPQPKDQFVLKFVKP